MRDDELVGVIIAGSEEDPYCPIGYAISAKEVYRNISRSMGGLPVRLLTATENKILSKKASGRDIPPGLIALYVSLLLSAKVHVGSIKPPTSQLPPEVRDIQTGNATLTALLRLGKVCSSLHSARSVDRWRPSRKSTAIDRLLRKPVEQNGEWLYSELLQYKEGANAVLLILALSGTWSDPEGLTFAILEIMDELNISPSPAYDHLLNLICVTCGRLKTFSWVHDSTRGYNPRLARSLGRIIFALYTDRFFVHTGDHVLRLASFFDSCYENPVLVVGYLGEVDEYNRRSLLGYNKKIAHVPRIFLAETDVRVDGKKVKRSTSLYGDVVEYDELNDLLKGLT